MLAQTMVDSASRLFNLAAKEKFTQVSKYFTGVGTVSPLESVLLSAKFSNILLNGSAILVNVTKTLSQHNLAPPTLEQNKMTQCFFSRSELARQGRRRRLVCACCLYLWCVCIFMHLSPFCLCQAFISATPSTPLSPTPRMPRQLSTGGEPETDSADRLRGGHSGPR